ncbi:MAG: hypothetical protein ACRD1Y_01630 [Terriglobales bacterium]
MKSTPKTQRKSGRARSKRATERTLQIADEAERMAAWWNAEATHPNGNRLLRFALDARKIAPLFSPGIPAPDKEMTHTIFKCSVIASCRAAGARGVYRRAADILHLLPGFERADETNLRLLAHERSGLVAYFEPPIGPKAGRPVAADLLRMIKNFSANSQFRLEFMRAIEPYMAEAQREKAAMFPMPKTLAALLGQTVVAGPKK